MNNNTHYRSITEFEKSLLHRLLEVEFPGCNEIKKQLEQCLVKQIDEYGSIKFKGPSNIKADVNRRIPIEAEIEDEDGVLIHLLLHVVCGQLDELEIYKDDSSSIIRMPDASMFRLVQLD